MKKIIGLLLVLVLMLSTTALVFADDISEGTSDDNSAIKEEIKQLVQELQALNAQIEGLHNASMEKRDTIQNLVNSAREAKDKEKLEAARGYKDQVKAITEEIRVLRASKEEIRLELKLSRQDKDFEAVKTELQQLIDYKNQIISKINERLSLLEEIITILQ